MGTINAGHKREWLQSNPESPTSNRFNIINSGKSLLTIAGMKVLLPDGGIWSVSYGGFVATGLGVLMFYFAIVHLKKQ